MTDPSKQCILAKNIGNGSEQNRRALGMLLLKAEPGEKDSGEIHAHKDQQTVQDLQTALGTDPRQKQERIAKSIIIQRRDHIHALADRIIHHRQSPSAVQQIAEELTDIAVNIHQRRIMLCRAVLAPDKTISLMIKNVYDQCTKQQKNNAVGNVILHSLSAFQHDSSPLLSTTFFSDIIIPPFAKEKSHHRFFTVWLLFLKKS